MNAARLAPTWSDAKGDPALMAEALAREIDCVLVAVLVQVLR